MLFVLTCHRTVDPELAEGRPPDGLLTSAEEAIFEALKTEKRRRDWLTGRYTAKHLVQLAEHEKSGTLISFQDFAIMKKENGAPRVSWRKSDNPRPVTLSISHSGDLSFCALLFQDQVPLGCDIEEVSPRSSTFIKDYFTSREQKMIDRLPADQRASATNVIWSGKESVLKALELGLTVDTRSVTCLPELNWRQAWQPFEINYDPERIPDPPANLYGRWREQEGYIYTLVAPATIFATEIIRELST